MKKRRFTEKKSISSVFSLFLAFALMVTSVLGSSLGTLKYRQQKGHYPVVEQIMTRILLQMQQI